MHETARLRQLGYQAIDEAVRGVPAGFLGDADDFGSIAAFLCSQQANFLTGCGVHVDGGAYAALL